MAGIQPLGRRLAAQCVRSFTPARSTPLPSRIHHSDAGHARLCRSFHRSRTRLADDERKPHSSTGSALLSAFNSRAPHSGPANPGGGGGGGTGASPPQPGGGRPPQRAEHMHELSNLQGILSSAAGSTSSFGVDLYSRSMDDDASDPQESRGLEPHHLHVFSHRHNTHITLTRPNRSPLLSLSCGNIGFKKSKRKQFDAAYQLAQYAVQQIEKRNLLGETDKLELVLSGFGMGREAVSKVILSTEGADLKKRIVRVADSTKLKFGGTRSKNPRRI